MVEFWWEASLGLKTANFSYPYMVEREQARCLTSFIRPLIPSMRAPPSDLFTFYKPSSKYYHIGIRVSAYEFWGWHKHSDHPSMPASWRLRRSCSSSPKAVRWQNFLSLGGYQSLLGPSTDWMKPTHFIESNLPYSKFTGLTVNTIQKKKKIPLQKHLE